jgi:3-phosphoshikimate 1-carboxyvinyltransferase
VLDRMGVQTSTDVLGDECGEPVGVLSAEPCAGVTGTAVDRAELPLLIDEIPALAMLAAHADGESRFRGAGELRVKESDRLGGVVEAIRALGGDARVEGDDLVVAGGGLSGGRASSLGDHRMAMAIAAGGLAATGPVTIDGMESAEVSFPGFVDTLSALGARIEA